MPGNVDNKSIFHKAVLIPFWVLQLINVILLLAFAALEIQYIVFLYGYRYCYTSSGYCYEFLDEDTQVPLGLQAGGAGLALGLSVIFLILHVTQIALFGRKKLTPGANFGFELPRFILITLTIIIEAAAAAYQFYDYAVLPLTCILWLLYLGTLIYACVIFHRSRRNRYRGGYHGQYPTGYGHGPYPPQGQYPPGPYQQGAYQQPQFHQQAQYPQSAQQSGQYQAYSPAPQGQQMQGIGHPQDVSRQMQTPVQHTSSSPPPQTQSQYSQSPPMGHQEIASAHQQHNITPISSPPPQELKAGYGS